MYSLIQFRKVIFIFLCFLLSLSLYSYDMASDMASDMTVDMTVDLTSSMKRDMTSDFVKDQSDDSWIKDYIKIDVSDDLYYGTIIKKYKIKREYLETLKWNNRISFYVDEVDENNLLKNTNMLIWFPYVFMPVGGYSYNRGFDLGFLYRMDNINNTLMSFTTATTFGQRGKFFQHFNFENPNILKDKRLRFFSTFSFFTSYPQYQSKLNAFSKSNVILELFNGIWKKLQIDFTRYNETGFYFISGLDYRIPKIEINSATMFELNYSYLSSIITGISETSVTEKIKNEHNFSVNIKEEIRWNKMKMTTTIPVGNDLTGSFKFYLPTGVGDFAKKFRFKGKIEERFTKVLFKDFAIKTRFILSGAYNISDDYSGDPYIRGYFDKELTGFFALLGNIDFYIPVMNVDITNAGSTPLVKDAKFLLYINIFVDGGFTIDNYDFVLDRFQYDETRKREGDTYQVDLSNGYLLTPAFTVGAGLRVYPYFLNFILRLDFGVNLIKAIVYQKPNVEFVFSFSDMY